MLMKVTPTAIPEVLILEPQVYGDERGFFYESFNARRFEELTGQRGHFVQDNHSRSARNVLRGLHYQVSQPQGKLVRVTAGAIFDVVVDLRSGSPFFGRWVGVEISAENRRQIWVPPGFAHGFVVTSANACTRPPITGRPNMSARSCGATRNWRSTGPSMARRSSRPRTARAACWPMPKYFHRNSADRRQQLPLQQVPPCNLTRRPAGGARRPRNSRAIPCAATGAAAYS
jgi:dTDP-4-dehydrorhamnose 3,5-epimerase